MVKVSVKVRSGSAQFWVSVQAQSIQRVADIVASWYPDRDVRMRSPMDPGGFSSRTLLSGWGDDESLVRYEGHHTPIP
jgi:hypothetical protein